MKGSPEKSVLYQQVANRVMPPPAFKLTLTADQIETIRRWIEGGALSDQPLASTEELAAERARFEKEALPIFSSRCFSCHGKDQPMAGLDLRTLASILKVSCELHGEWLDLQAAPPNDHDVHHVPSDVASAIGRSNIPG